MKKAEKGEGLISCLKIHIRALSMGEQYYSQEWESDLTLTLDKHSVENLTVTQLILLTICSDLI